MEGVDERKIEDYLEKHGIASMQDVDKKMVGFPVDLVCCRNYSF